MSCIVYASRRRFRLAM